MIETLLYIRAGTIDEFWQYYTHAPDVDGLAILSMSHDDLWRTVEASLCFYCQVSGSLVSFLLCLLQIAGQLIFEKFLFWYIWFPVLYILLYNNLVFNHIIRCIIRLFRIQTSLIFLEARLSALFLIQALLLVLKDVPLEPLEMFGGWVFSNISSCESKVADFHIAARI